MTAGLKVENLSHSYGKKQALKDVSFSVEQGGFCALLGPNGAGKSTLFSLLTHLFVPSGGEIEVAGVDLIKNPASALAKIGVVFQQPTLDLDLTVQQNLRYFAALHGLSGKNAETESERALDRLNMLERRKEKVRALNGGHRRRMEIARALIHKPTCLLLDEATVGLDVESRKLITDHMHLLAREEGLTVLWATHLVDEVQADDQLVILHKGAVIRDGLCKEITGDHSLGNVFSDLTTEVMS